MMMRNLQSSASLPFGQNITRRALLGGLGAAGIAALSAKAPAQEVTIIPGEYVTTPGGPVHKIFGVTDLTAQNFKSEVLDAAKKQTVVVYYFTPDEDQRYTVMGMDAGFKDEELNRTFPTLHAQQFARLFELAKRYPQVKVCRVNLKENPGVILDLRQKGMSVRVAGYSIHTARSITLQDNVLANVPLNLAGAL